MKNMIIIMIDKGRRREKRKIAKKRIKKNVPGTRPCVSPKKKSGEVAYKQKKKKKN
jgi:hypothetical protein